VVVGYCTGACIGCTSIECEKVQLIPWNTGLFTPDNPVVSEANLYALTEQQQEKFLNFYQ
jgi:hypothetical protein